MSDPVLVTWKMWLEASYETLLAEGAIQLRPIEALDGTSAACAIAQDYWSDDQRWDEEFGLDQQMLNIYVVLDAPVHLTGEYLVWLERVVKASARKLTAPPGAVGVRTGGGEG